MRLANGQSHLLYKSSFALLRIIVTLRQEGQFYRGCSL